MALTIDQIDQQLADEGYTQQTNPGPNAPTGPGSVTAAWRAFAGAQQAAIEAAGSGGATLQSLQISPVTAPDSSDPGASSPLYNLYGPNGIYTQYGSVNSGNIYDWSGGTETNPNTYGDPTSQITPGEYATYNQAQAFANNPANAGQGYLQMLGQQTVQANQSNPGPYGNTQSFSFDPSSGLYYNVGSGNPNDPSTWEWYNSYDQPMNSVASQVRGEPIASGGAASGGTGTIPTTLTSSLASQVGSETGGSTGQPGIGNLSSGQAQYGYGTGPGSLLDAETSAINNDISAQNLALAERTQEYNFGAPILSGLAQDYEDVLGQNFGSGSVSGNAGTVSGSGSTGSTGSTASSTTTPAPGTTGGIPAPNGGATSATNTTGTGWSGSSSSSGNGIPDGVDYSYPSTLMSNTTLAPSGQIPTTYATPATIPQSSTWTESQGASMAASNASNGVPDGQDYSFPTQYTGSSSPTFLQGAYSGPDLLGSTGEAQPSPTFTQPPGTGGTSGFQNGIQYSSPSQFMSSTGGATNSTSTGTTNSMDFGGVNPVLSSVNGGSTNNNTSAFSNSGVSSNTGNGLNPIDPSTWAQFYAPTDAEMGALESQAIQQIQQTVPMGGQQNQAISNQINQTYGQIGSQMQQMVPTAMNALSQIGSQAAYQAPLTNSGALNTAQSTNATGSAATTAANQTAEQEAVANAAIQAGELGQLGSGLTSLLGNSGIQQALGIGSSTGSGSGSAGSGNGQTNLETNNTGYFNNTGVLGPPAPDTTQTTDGTTGVSDEAKYPGGGDATVNSLTDLTSDKKAKKDIKSYKPGLKAVEKLKPVSYKYNGKGDTVNNRPGISVLAQNAKKAVPNSTFNYKSRDGNNYEGLHPMALLMANTNAIKELDRKISSLHRG